MSKNNKEWHRWTVKPTSIGIALALLSIPFAVTFVLAVTNPNTVQELAGGSQLPVWLVHASIATYGVLALSLLFGASLSGLLTLVVVVLARVDLARTE